jgi:hypothetical protein
VVTEIQRQRYPRTQIIKLVKFANDPDGAEPHRSQVRADLEAIASGKDLPDAAIKRLRQEASGVTIQVEEFRKTDREILLRYSGDDIAIASYLTLLIYQARPDDRKFPGDLRLCRLESCGNLFFASDVQSPDGGPRPVFCCREHMLKKHALSGADRVRKHREHRASKHK